MIANFARGIKGHQASQRNKIPWLRIHTHTDKIHDLKQEKRDAETDKFVFEDYRHSRPKQ
ncbi:MAG: hypothetical protein GXY37_06675 [Chloroflexi bacterium]|nr:hypothetical protein [Chloroflexota bacterium]